MTADIKTRDKDFAISTIASYLDDGYEVTAFKADDGVYEIYGYKDRDGKTDCAWK